MSTKNPFSDIFNAWTSAVPAVSDAFDFNKAIEAGRQNAKAFSDAAKAASEGAQAVSRRQAEILQKNAEEASKFWKNVNTSGKTPEAGITAQAEYTKQSFESAVANSKEILEMAAKSNAEASDILAKRLSAALSELSENTSSPKKKSAAA